MTRIRQLTTLSVFLWLCPAVLGQGGATGAISGRFKIPQAPYSPAPRSGS